MAVEFDDKKLVKILADEMRKFLPDNKQVSSTLFRAANVLELEIKRGIQRKTPRGDGKPKELIDTGALLKSIKKRIGGKKGNSFSIDVGSFGVKYARIHEYGGTINSVRERKDGTKIAVKATIVEKRYMRDAFDRAIPVMLKVLRQLGGR